MAGRLLNPNITAKQIVSDHIAELVTRWNGETFVVATQILDKIEGLPFGEVRNQYRLQLRELLVKGTGDLSPNAAIVSFVLFLWKDDDDNGEAQIEELSRLTTQIKWKDDPGLSWAFLQYLNLLSHQFRGERSIQRAISTIVAIIKGQIGDLLLTILTAGILRLACPTVTQAQEGSE